MSNEYKVWFNKSTGVRGRRGPLVLDEWVVQFVGRPANPQDQRTQCQLVRVQIDSRELRSRLAEGH